ncbi:hypothetical protein PHMEG_00026319, partial [Phytophthora megakarya]
EFPINVDTQEMLPLTIMLKRKRDRNDVDIASGDAKWRKLRTFKLVDGEVEGETTADRLNAALKKGMSDAMKSTKKRVAKEKEDKASAGSKQILSSYFKKLDHAAEEGETTNSQRSSSQNISTPERKKKRKPLTPRENTDHYKKDRSRDKDVLKKRHDGDKTFKKSRPEDDSTRSVPKFKYDKQESREDRSRDKDVLKKRHGGDKTFKKSRPEDDSTRSVPKFKYDKQESRKRKRNDSTPIRPEQAETAPRATQKTLSTYFSANQKQHRSKKRAGIDLNKFVSHAEKDDVKEFEKLQRRKQQHLDNIDAYLVLDKKQTEAVDRIKAASEGDNAKDHHTQPDDSDKKSWDQQRSKYRKTSAAPGALRLWLTPLGAQKNSLEETSRGSPTKPQQTKQRTLNLSGDKQTSPKMDRKNMNFMIPHNSPPKPRKRRDEHPKQDSHPQKKRGSLGTVSARVRPLFKLTLVLLLTFCSLGRHQEL